jgi:hypothetical protein
MAKLLSQTRAHTSVRRISRRGTDLFTLAIPPSQAYYGCRLTLYEADSHSAAKVLAQPLPGARGRQEIHVEWWHGVADRVRYQLEAFTRPVNAAPDAPSPTRQLTGFVPTQHGFHFANRFPSVPHMIIPIPFGQVQFGDASKGLCGGMVFCALDYFLARRPIPAEKKPPVTGSLFDAMVGRLLNSFNLPLGILNYITMMDPAYPDGETRSSGGHFAPHGRAWQTIRVEWPIIKQMLDSGHPCPLGLVRVKTTKLSKLGHNHQVLATGYDVSDDRLTLFIYDPNFPDRDDLTLSLSLAAPEQPTAITYSAPDRSPVYAFFHVHYKFRSPPA